MENFDRYEKKQVEGHASGIIKLGDKDQEEFVFRQVVIGYTDGRRVTIEEATLDLATQLQATLRDTPGLVPIEEPTVFQQKDGRWAMIAKLKPVNRYANSFIDKLRSSGRTLERTLNPR